MVNGKPRHSQSQGSVEQANQDIENMLTTWMADNQTNKWSEGVRFVQFMKNRAYHSAIKRSLYEAMFGCSAKVELSSSIIPQNVLHSINTEEDLEKFKDSQETGIMGSQSNLTQENILLSPASTESLIEIQEFINSNLKLPSTPLIEDTVMKNIQLPCPSKESPVHVEEVITELPSTSTESPPQFHTDPVKRSIQDIVCIVCQKQHQVLTSVNRVMFVHVISSEIDPKEEGYGKIILCNICKKNMDQKIWHDEVKKGLEKQAKKMLAVSNANHPNVDEGVTVRIKVLEVDRAKTDACSILAVVLSKTGEGFYKLGTKTGILKQLYSGSEFSVCKERFLSKEDVPAVEISLCQTAIK